MKYKQPKPRWRAILQTESGRFIAKVERRTEHAARAWLHENLIRGLEGQLYKRRYAFYVHHETVEYEDTQS